MRFLIILLLSVGIATASGSDKNEDHGWEIGKEYQYLVRSRTMTGLDTLSDQHTGILIKAILQLQYTSPDTFRCKLLNPQYAQIHKSLPDGWDSHISDQMLEYKNLPLSSAPFIVKLKHKVVRELIVTDNLPTWEINIIKSVVSQFQADTQGENLRRSKGVQVPDNENPFATFHSMEDSIGGKCEVLYDIVPLPEQLALDRPDLLPNQKLLGKEELLYVTKTKNYEKCDQRVDYYFGISGNVNWESDIRNNDQIMKRSSSSYMVLSGTLKNFVIQSTVTTTKIIMKPRLVDEQESVVMSKMNLTLVNVQKITNQLPEPSRPISCGNLVYTYNDPFSGNEHRRFGQPSESLSSTSNEMDANSESNEELRLMRGMFGHSLKTNVISDEDKTNWVKPTLTDAPRNPFLPLFIGNKGKAVLLSDNVDSIKMVQTLVEEIAREMENPNTMPEQDTLEKFTILSRLTSSMSLEQITRADKNLRSIMNELGSDEQSQIKKENTRAVFRDAVASAGTGPALMAIKNWIETKYIEGLEAAEVVSVLPKTARTPTAEYVDTLFLMASNPEIQKQKFLNSSVVLSLAELIQLTQVSNTTMFNYYPVNVFGRLSSKQNDAVVRRYIPFFEEQLRKAILDGDSPKIQTYIIALGSTAHPKILSVFEPYLEGKKQVSTYQRFLMVMSLKKLTHTKPSLARSVLYKIYLNTWDASHIRSAAVYLLMNTNPPLDMLTRMAQFTNSDPSRQVNSAVKSSIEKATELSYPEWQGLASNARKVLHLLNPADKEYHFLPNYLTEAEVNDQLSYRVLINYIGSEDSIIPMSMFLSMKPSYNGFIGSPDELGLSVSNVRSLLEMFWHKSEKRNVEESLAENIAKSLNIESDQIEQVEGTLFFRSPYLSRYLCFDNHTIERAIDSLSSSKYSGRVNINKWFSKDIVLSFPTETGLPFVYALHKPALYKLSGSAKPDIKSGFDVRLLMSGKTQGRVGFITPFDHQTFVSGIDENLQVFLPLRLNYHLNLEKSRIDVTLRPSERDANTKIRLGHLSVIPYTSQYDVLSLRPLLLSKNTHRIETEKPRQIRIPQDLNSVFSVEVEGDLLKHYQQWVEGNKKWDDMTSPLLLSEGTYEKIDLYVKPNLKENEAIKLFAILNTKEIRNKDKFDEESWDSGNKAVIPTQYTFDSPTRRQDFLEKVSKGINSGNSLVVDAGLELPGASPSNYVLTWSVAASDIEHKYRSLVYMRRSVNDETFETCGNFQMKSPILPPFDYKKILNSNTTSQIRFNLQAGKTCSEGINIFIDGLAEQTEDYKKYVQESSMVKKCEKSQSNRIKNCQGAVKLAQNVNKLDITINVDSNEDTNAILDTFKESKKILGSPNVEFTGLQEKSDNNDIKIQIQLSPEMTTADVVISNNKVSLTYPDIDISPFGLDNDDMDEDENEDEGSCTLEKNEAETFDGKVYPLQLGKCPHVLLTTFPKHNPNKFNELWDIPENMKLIIAAQETEDNRKEIKVAMGNDEVTLQASGTELEVRVNGQKVRCSEKQTYQQVRNDETVFDIVKLPGPALRLSSDKYDLNVVYDGKNVQIKLPATYKKSIRGLCGDYDGRPENDFVTPMNCLLQKPEEFASMYILKEKCEGNALKHAEKARLSKCFPKVVRISDVVSDDEAGRPFTNWKQWGYHKKDNKDDCHGHRTRVTSKDNKLCFTMRPVLKCNHGCKANETRQKKYDLFCLPKNERSLGLKNRVEQGVNPDLSQRTPSHSEMLTVPVECVAA